MEKIKITPTIKDGAKRLDLYLSEYFLGKYSRTFLQKLISSGMITINGKKTKPNQKISQAEAIDIVFSDPLESRLKAEAIPLNIIYEDKDLLVINKPAGMVVHPGAGVKSSTLANALAGHCKDLSGIGGVLRPGIVHRLDKDTSGIMIAAKNDFTHRQLSKQFKDRSIQRKYIALVEGVLEFDNDRINLPIARHPKDKEKMSVGFANAKEASTIYRVITRFKDSTLLEITPITGRTHQIRVHMKAIGHPIVGDKKYGARTDTLGRQALHAKWIKFFHPGLKKYMEFSCDAPF